MAHYLYFCQPLNFYTMNSIFRYFILAIVLASSGAAFSQKSKKVKINTKGWEPGIYANMITDKGTIVLKLEHEKAPMTVANFVGLAEGKFKPFDTIHIEKPFFDGLKFHRVIANFMIQGGDPKGTGMGDPGYKFFDEFDNDLIHDGPGVLSMANSGPNTNGSQFFITHKDTPWLNKKHSVFGRVTQGQDVVDKIEQNDVIQQVIILRVGKQFKKYNPTQVFQAEYKRRLAITEAERAELEAVRSMSIPDYMVYFKEQMTKRYPNAIQTPSGLMLVIHNAGGQERPTQGSNVTVHYTGYLLNGDKFDSSKDRNQPFNFPVGMGRVIKGWDEGIPMLGKGGKATLIIPYFLGYGDRGTGPIPAYATLIFEVEMLDF
jgi:peptidyl-prolyl cis-trans isomerase A (cyclophilin A)